MLKILLLHNALSTDYYFVAKVSVSSLNRHAVATREDVGTPKAICLKKHFSAIFPECQVDAKVMLYDSSSEDEILSGNPDFVLDCIDNIDTKVKPFLIFCLSVAFIFSTPELLTLDVVMNFLFNSFDICNSFR